MIAEMRKLAVIAQNNLENIMRLRSFVQDMDKPVRTFMARLKAMAEVCKLTVKCPCVPGIHVSYADKEIYHCLIKIGIHQITPSNLNGRMHWMPLNLYGHF